MAKQAVTKKTETLTLRLDPKMKFAIEILSREQKRTLASVIEWAISHAISNQTIGSQKRDMAALLDQVWSTDEATRVVNLCLELPEVLTYEEMRIWETIQASPPFWKDFANSGATRENLKFGLVRLNWNFLVAHVEEHKNLRAVIPVEDKWLLTR